MSPVPAAPLTDASRPAAMRFIMLTVLIDMVSIGLIIPVLPAIVGTFTSDRSEQVFWYGAVAATFGIANFFGSPILGALSDRYGRRPVLLLGFTGFACSFFGTALATHLWMLLAIRVVSGALQANAAVANAYVADITPPEDRARRFGQLGAMFGLGFILGPVMGGLLGSIDVHLPFFAAGALALVNLVYGYFVLPESLPMSERRPVSWRSANPLAALKQLAGLRNVGGLLAVIGLANLAQFVLHSSWVLSTEMRFGWGPRENGWSLFAVGVMGVLVQGVLLKRLLATFGAPRLVSIGLVSGAIAYACFGLVTAGWMMYIVIFLNFFASAVPSSITSLISEAADARTQGQTMGALAALGSLTAVVAPIVGTGLLGAVSHLPAQDWRIGAPFLFCALLMTVATGFALSHFARQRRRAASTLPV